MTGFSAGSGEGYEYRNMENGVRMGVKSSKETSLNHESVIMKIAGG